MPNFETISTIREDEPAWSQSLYLSFDIDWAHDEVLSDTIELVESAGVAATWFVTHDTLVLGRLRANPQFELGIHPNFNFLLEGDTRNGSSAQEVIARHKAIFPEATVVRSHSMTQNSGLLDHFKSAGMTHDVNHFVPSFTGISLKPWGLWNGLIRVPYCWEDDVHIMYAALGRAELTPSEICSAHARKGALKVFDFHPIHVFLNTENLDRYECTRPLHQTPKELIKQRFAGYGTRNRLIELLELARAS